MKKLTSYLFIGALCTSLLTGCGSKSTDPTKIVVGASSTPHAEILAIAADYIESKGYQLDIREFNDYILPNTALDTGELDANYFQHQPYLDSFNKENGTDLLSVANIHFEPLGIYAGTADSLDSLTNGSKIAIPNDTTNEARALLLLETAGLIEVDDNAGINATIKDITNNPNNYEFVELEAAQVARSLPDVAIGVINGNYALSAGLNVETEVLLVEDSTSLAGETYANILVVKAGNENSEKTQILKEALQSDEVKTFIEETFNGIVLSTF